MSTLYSMILSRGYNLGGYQWVRKDIKGSFFKHFMTIYDPRQEGKVKHKLGDIIFIAVAASVCNCDEWEDIQA